ncbi:MAG: hypothetical protein NT151_00210 [Acidobacteria bacterium]|nr:hypothetical protein [Acidobacteriota bacterium]
MAIRKSAASEVRLFIEHLSDADPPTREAALARLSVAGVRAVPHLLDALDSTTSPVARAMVLKGLEATGDRRGIDAALGVLHSRATDPKVASAAVRLLGSHLDAAETDRALDALSAIVLDPAYQQALRLEAFAELERMPARLIAPIRKWLAADPDEAVRRRATAQGTSGATPDDRLAQLDLVASGHPTDPTALRQWVQEAAQDASLSTLHRLVEVACAREEQAPSAADRDEWRAARGVIHLALATRASRVAIYDLRESLAQTALPLSEDFVSALRLVGDATCLEPIVAAIARMPIDIETRDHRIHDSLVDAGRAIVEREGLTRRHAAVKKILKTWPDAGALLFAPPALPQCFDSR